jgi:molybdopterin-guanine dinucleotide biosynthesis protein A
MMNITGVIMAGGKSSRMGKDKGLLLFRGNPLVQYAIDLLKPFCSGLFISTANEAYAQFGIPLVKDDIPDCGPMGGIYSALKASNTNYIFVLACDMPFVSSITIQTLLNEVANCECVIPNVNGKLEPLCAIYSKSMIPLLKEKLEKSELALYQLIADSNSKMVYFDTDLHVFNNCNTPNELDGWNNADVGKD